MESLFSSMVTLDAILFTSSKSLIHPYTLPVMIPFALLIVHYWDGFSVNKAHWALSLAIPLILSLVFFSGTVDQVLFDNSDKNLVISASKNSTAIYALKKKSYSSQYYSNGQIKVVSANDLLEELKEQKNFSVIIQHKDFEGLPLIVKDQLELIGESKKKSKIFLYKAVHKKHNGTAAFIP